MIIYNFCFPVLEEGSLEHGASVGWAEYRQQYGVPPREQQELQPVGEAGCRRVGIQGRRPVLPQTRKLSNRRIPNFR